MAAEMSDWASRTLFMASSISLLEASAFRLALRFKPAAKGFSFGSVMNFNSWSAACGFMLAPGNPKAAIASMLGTPKGFPPIP